MREFAPSVADDAGQWRSARPLVEARGPANGGESGNSTPSMQSTPNLAETEATVSLAFPLVYSSCHIVVARNKAPSEPRTISETDG